MKDRALEYLFLTLGLGVLLVLVQACGGDRVVQANKQPVIGESFQSECLEGARLLDADVEVQVNGDSVLIVDHRAEFNCCLDVWMQASVNGDKIVVVEIEDPDDQNACDCTCPYELSIGISNLADGQYTVEVYREVAQPDALVHQESICLGDCQTECSQAVDCLEHSWGIYCQGHWSCSEGTCEEVCDMETCGDGTCDSDAGENLESCKVDCEDHESECELPMDCLEHSWGIYCQGHWSCSEGTCEEVCDMETCGDGTCDSDAGENLESCRVDCEDHDVILAGFQPSSCGECGAQECYKPDAPLGESTFEYTFEADPANPGHYQVRAIHHVSCIDVAILGAELDSHADELLLTETFDYDNPVDCYCNYQADIVITGLLPGTYHLKIFDNDHSKLLIDLQLVIDP